MSHLDYSKWDHIEVSDDEDDTHPNIDTPSLFRWRHQARVDRMAEREKEKKDLAKEKEQIEETRKRLMKQDLQEADKKEAKEKLEELQKQEREWRKKEDELNKKEKSEPWNIDTICKDGFSKSVINKEKKTETDDHLSEEEQMKRQREYTNKYEKDLKTYGMMSKVEDSQKFLQDHSHLVCEKAANFLVIWCIDLEVEEKHALMETVAHQTIILQFILELSKTLKRDPRNCFVSFFNKFKQADPEYRAGFNDELRSFKERVKERAKIRIQKAMEEIEAEEREKRLGPGGLDPQEVFESLPKEMQECFERRDIPMLQEVILKLDPEQAKYHMKRCVDSGLWVPGGGKKAEEDDNNIYEEVQEEQADVISEKADKE